jgi:phosphate starvation-inducible PhoH-like protein
MPGGGKIQPLNPSSRGFNILTTDSIQLRSREEMQELFGDFDTNLRLVKDKFQVKVYAKGLDVFIAGEGEDVRGARSAMQRMIQSIREEGGLAGLAMEDVLPTPGNLGNGHGAGLSGGNGNGQGAAGKDADLALANLPHFKPQTKGQEDYLNAIERNEVVLCHGPAGTGKTYLAVAAAIDFYRRKRIQRIVLTRPAVEAGEKLGFLPGTLYEKVNPYLIPLFDALNDLLRYERVRRLMERNVIEVAPLAFMRGRSLNNAFIILDEAQNTTPSQMKMFLTRLGQGSRAVVTGDTTQVDLDDPERSGFVHAMRVMRGAGPGIATIELTRSDVVRSAVVQRIVEAYDRHETN